MTIEHYRNQIGILRIQYEEPEKAAYLQTKFLKTELDEVSIGLSAMVHFFQLKDNSTLQAQIYEKWAFQESKNFLKRFKKSS